MTMVLPCDEYINLLLLAFSSSSLAFLFFLLLLFFFSLLPLLFLSLLLLLFSLCLGFSSVVQVPRPGKREHMSVLENTPPPTLNTHPIVHSRLSRGRLLLLLLLFRSSFSLLSLLSLFLCLLAVGEMTIVSDDCITLKNDDYTLS